MLLYKVTIAGVNDVLRVDFGDHSIESAYQFGLDVGPQATAEGIVSFDQYKQKMLI